MNFTIDRAPARLTALVLGFVTQVACSSPESSGASVGSATAVGGMGGGPGGSSACFGGGEVSINDANNYSFSNTLTVKKSTLKDATDLTFDWSGISVDFFGKPIDAAEDIDMALLSLWHLTPEGIEEALKTDDLKLSLNAGALTAYPDGTFTSENLLDFTLFGEDVPDEDVWSWFDTSLPDYGFPQDEYTFMLMVSKGTVAGKNARMLHMFTVDPNATETTLSLGNDSTVLEYSVDLQSPLAVEMPVADSAVSVDWGDMGTTALGTEFSPFNVNQVVVAHYSLTRAELEEEFLDLEEIADGWWSTEDIAGTSVELGTLSAADGSAFAGISGEGLWLVALFCTANCNNPAPVSITFLEPCP